MGYMCVCVYVLICKVIWNILIPYKVKNRKDNPNIFFTLPHIPLVGAQIRWESGVPVESKDCPCHTEP